MAKKESPSHKAYREKNPTVSITLTEDRKKLLDKFRGDLSYGELLKKILVERIDSYSKGRRDGYARGYRVGCQEGGRDSYEKGCRDGRGEGEAYECIESILKVYGVDSLVRLFSGDSDWQ